MQDQQSLPLFILIDGHSLAFRAYYALAKARHGPLHTSTGIPTSVCFGFLNSLIQVITDQKPQYLAIAFDLQEPTFRHKADANYKADRKETPEDFIRDLENLQELLKALNITIVTYPGYEADDVLGTLANQGSKSGYQVKILSGDRDLFQLVDESKNISVLYLERNAVRSLSSEGYTEFNSKAVEVKLGVKPTQVIDYKALCGDRSDSIPGVKGIGDKTAVKFLKKYGNLQGIYGNLDQIKGANNKKLREGMKDAEHSRHLAAIITDIPIEIDLTQCKLKGFNLSSLQIILQRLELNKFLKEINQIKNIFEIKEQVFHYSNQDIFKKKHENKPRQLSLFPGQKLVESSAELITKDNLNSSQINPETITNLEQLNNLVDRLKQYIGSQHFIAWDTETTSLEPRDAELVGIGCCWGHKITDIAYIPTGHTNGIQLKKKVVLEKLRPIFENEQYAKVFQNTKFDRLVLYHQGIKLTGVVFDTMLASYVLHSEMSHNLSDLCHRYLPEIIPQSYKELGILKGKTIASLDIKTVANYCGMDAYITYSLVNKLQGELKSIETLKKLLIEVEQPLESVLAVMENTGVRIDTNYLQELSQQLQQDLESIEQQVYQEAGEKFNLGSPKQLAEILFEKLDLNRKKSRKIKIGYSTDHATLEKLQGDHPIIDYILEHRTLSKLKSTYVDALPALVRDDTQRIHTNFNQTVTATGRLSSSNPNLQNIPIRSQFSRQLRKVFIPKENWLLVSADYSQIELRILAHLSQESVLLEAYQNGQDVHTVTAKLLFNKETITPKERNLGKTINFGVIYGMGAQRFAREAGVTVAEGKTFIDKYHQRYARVFEFLEKTKKEAITKGFVTTILGRRRYFNFVTYSLQKLKGTNPKNINLNELHLNYTDARSLRAAANAPIQGSSADIIKVAMIKIQKILSHYQANLLLQVHDELIFEVPPEELDELQEKIKKTMENALILTVPLVVDIYSGNNWMEAK
ncbi:MAG: DNA polymerase I [cyanobacterium endosymbiont of Rhopalodia musculus]|uniref:DNA polymerase I n=1 Tax=cyanobacterium endosymbiont of Epithemia clementina EcSB TaxID=3034674 RepID=UPI0024807D29|nr:DNA polymerase I [cyanobacterium endosymbiont of Epithemia clementina EcSB]WGT67088.1 DNA polymerase I [cyanobacterium endosymbiont of Epithemia clementina EcSB]